MAWFKGDDKSHSNPKLLAVELVGTGLHWRAVAWCSDHETDGRVPATVIPSLSPELPAKARRALVASMVREALWVPEEDPGGRVVAYWINDYLEYNPSRAQLEERRKKEKARLANRRVAR